MKNYSKETKTFLKMITISQQKNAKAAFLTNGCIRFAIYAAKSGMGINMQ